MASTPPRRALQQTESLIRELGDRALARQEGIGHRFKADKTYVTSVDREVEAALVEHIGRNYPDHRVLGEESGSTGPENGPWTWVVDPIDGTSNYALGLPLWGLSVGLLEGGGPRYGWIYLPALGEMFKATSGQGAFLNGRPIRANRSGEMRPQDLFAVDTRSLISYDFSFPQDARALGSAAMAVCNAACGRFVGYFLAAWYVWDIAAALLLAREAGLEVTTMDGQGFDSFKPLDGTPGPPLLFAGPGLHGSLLTGIKPKGGDAGPDIIFNRGA